MLKTIFNTLVPVAAIILLGFTAGRMKAFSKSDRTMLTRLTLVWLLPALLLSATLKTPRESLLDYHLPLVFLLGMVLPSFSVFTFFKLFRKRDTRESTLKAGLMANPDLVFMGLPIMTQLLGPASIFPILIANFLLSLILVPLTTVLLTIGSEGAKQQERGVFVKALTKSLREPRVWVPTLGALLVLAKVQTPAAVIHLLDKMGEPTTGISLFVVGLIIAAEEVKLTASIAWNVVFKNVLQPALMYLIVFTFGIKGSLAREAILLMALPTGVNMAMFAEEFDTLVTECSTTVLVTRLVVFVTIPVLIAITAHMQ